MKPLLFSVFIALALNQQNSYAQTNPTALPSPCKQFIETAKHCAQNASTKDRTEVLSKIDDLNNFAQIWLSMGDAKSLRKLDKACTKLLNNFICPK